MSRSRHYRTASSRRVMLYLAAERASPASLTSGRACRPRGNVPFGTPHTPVRSRLRRRTIRRARSAYGSCVGVPGVAVSLATCGNRTGSWPIRNWRPHRPRTPSRALHDPVLPSCPPTMTHPRTVAHVRDALCPGSFWCFPRHGRRPWNSAARSESVPTENASRPADPANAPQSTEFLTASR